MKLPQLGETRLGFLFRARHGGPGGLPCTAGNCPRPQEPSLRRCEQRMLNPLLAVLRAAYSASTRSGRRDPDRPGARYRTYALFDGGGIDSMRWILAARALGI